MAQLNWIVPALLIWTLFATSGGDADREEAAVGTPTTWMMYDLELERRIRATIETDERLKAAIDVIAVSAKNEATLSGTVSSTAAHDKALQLARSALAGLTVNDKIAIKPSA
jgi:osmotically-inducible protein OsmY